MRLENLYFISRITILPNHTVTLFITRVSFKKSPPLIRCALMKYANFKGGGALQYVGQTDQFIHLCLVARNCKDTGKGDEHVVRLNKTCHCALSVDITALWLRESHPWKHKATPTRAHTSRASQAWHAGPAHYYNAKLLVAKETWGRGRVPVSMAAGLHPANCLPPMRLDRRRQGERRETGKKKWGQNEVRRKAGGGYGEDVKEDL